MQDPTFTAAGFPDLKTQFPEHEQLRCPRCDSTNTKFCYYNNYNLSQPRHFCKSCKRYWTKGGSLRNIPVGGGSRKNTKRSAPPSKHHQHPSQRVVQNSSASATTPSDSGSDLNQDHNPSLKSQPAAPILGSIGADMGSVTPAGTGVSFTSLMGLASEGRFGNLIQGLGPHGNNNGPRDGSGQDSGSGVVQGSGIPSDGYVINGLRNGWPDLAIYTTPGSKYE